jgi:hypothetical protein
MASSYQLCLWKQESFLVLKAFFRSLLESLKKAVAAEIQKLTKVYKALGGIGGSVGAKPRRKMSKHAREKIAAAQRKRWAKQRRAA